MFWSELAQGLGVGECLHCPTGGDEGNELELVEVELKAAAVAMKLSSVVLCPPRNACTEVTNICVKNNFLCDNCV